MNVYTVLESNCSALVDDSQLQANAQSWYGRDLSVFIDQDADNPPDADETADGTLAPSIQLHSWFKRAAEDNRKVFCGYELMITVADPDDAVRDDDVAEFSGTARLNAIVTRALDVIRADKPAGSIMSYEYETDTVTFFPAMLAGVHVEFKAELRIGQDPFD